MSRLSIVSKNEGESTVEELYKDLGHKIVSSPLRVCPVDLASSFLRISHSQSCGKCVPCRIGLARLIELMDSVLDGNATMDTLETIETISESICSSSDCAIGYEAANMVLKSVRGFREDFEEHILYGRCAASIKNQAVPCRSHCPAGVDVPGYIALIHAGKYNEAVKLIRKDNPLPAACGLVCEHPCESRCKRTLIDDPVNIRGLKRFAVEHEDARIEEKCAPATGKRIAVIGGGPAGLTCAYYLALMGHSVKIFEQKAKLGGMLRYGIPNYRFPKDILDKEIDGILNLGIEYETNVNIGTDVALADLQREYDSVFIGIGAQKDRKLNIPGEESEGVISAVYMLRDIGDGKNPDFTGKEVVVVGGGNVAMDAARSAIRFGAKSVSIAYRRRRDDMTAIPSEIDGAVADGCEIHQLYAPKRIEVDENDQVKALWCKPQIVGPIKNGRPVPLDSDQPEERVPCDVVLMAVGQRVDSDYFAEVGLPVKWGNIETYDSGNVKEMDRLYAGGDCVTGPATVIMAVAAGKVAAANIDETLGYHHKIEADVTVPTAILEDFDPIGRINSKERPAYERIHDTDLMELCMTPVEAHQESSRCLRCDYYGFGRFKGGREDQW
ncbi:MAG: NAD(P)-binding protein [Anaerovoracaceae bacterium]|jgi:NADPH-dependent glutamate synthase beta subunit-like oxidoreductase